MLISIIRRGAHPLVLSVCSIPSFEEVQGIVRISFPYPGRRSSLLSRYLGGACPSFFGMELSSVA